MLEYARILEDGLPIHVPLDALYRSIMREHGCLLVPLSQETKENPLWCILLPDRIRIERDEGYCTKTMSRYDLFFPDNFYFTWYHSQQDERRWSSLNIPLDDLPVK